MQTRLSTYDELRIATAECEACDWAGWALGRELDGFFAGVERHREQKSHPVTCQEKIVREDW